MSKHELDLLKPHLETVRIRFPSHSAGAQILYTDDTAGLTRIAGEGYGLEEVIEHFYPFLYQKLYFFLFCVEERSIHPRTDTFYVRLLLREEFSKPYGVLFDYAVQCIDAFFSYLPSREYTKSMHANWICDYKLTLVPDSYINEEKAKFPDILSKWSEWSEWSKRKRAWASPPASGVKLAGFINIPSNASPTDTDDSL